MTPPVPLDARISGAAVFDTGAISPTTWISTTLAAASGSYALRVIPLISASRGDTLSLSAALGPIPLSKDGKIAALSYIPLIYCEE